jgi:hypothetical protein
MVQEGVERLPGSAVSSELLNERCEDGETLIQPLFSPARPPDGERLTEPASPPSTQTLGVLLVHGIGSQRPGDTLVHVGRSIHRWLCDFLKHLDIEVVAATLAGNPLLPNHPTPGSSLHLTSRFASRRCRNALNWQTEL